MTGAPSTSSGSNPGISLQAVIDAPRRLDELSTARVIGEAAEAVHKAQKGGQPLGTLMPQAIVLTTSGISLAQPATPSIAYSAPERVRGQAGDRRSDVFTLGIVLWEALAHERLFDAPTDDARKTAVLERVVQPPSELNANVPAELDAICKKALDRDPANRYQSAKVMAAEISAVLDDAGYPDNHDEIASYLTAAFPEGAPAAATSIGAAIAAKLASAPATATSTRQQLNVTMHGMAPIREPAVNAPEPAKIEPPKVEAPKVEPAKVEPAKVAKGKSGKSGKHSKIDPGKTMQIGSGLSLPDLPKADAPSKVDAPAKVEAPAKIEAKAPELERSKTPSGGLSPMAFMKPVAPVEAPRAAPSILAAAPASHGPPAMPEPASSMISTAPGTASAMTTAPGTGIPTLAPATVHPATAAVNPPTPALLASLTPAAAKAPATIVDEPKPKALIVDDPKPKAAIAPSISSAETVATPALVPNAPPAAAPSGVIGLPALPPGASRSFDDDFATNANSPVYPDKPVAQAAAQATVDPSAAVSLPRPRSASRPGTDAGRESKDVLADWGWSTDSHAAIDDGGHYEEDAPNAGRKRLLIAIGGSLGAILLIVLIAVAAGGGGDDKDKAKEEPAIADTSRTAESVVAKTADPAPAVPTAPPASDPTQPPATGDTPAPSAPIEPAAVDTATVEAAKVEAAKVEAANAEAAKVEAAKVEAANAEAAKADAAKADAANQKIAAATAAKTETANLKASNLAKAEAARLEAANLKAAKAEDARRDSEARAAAKAEAARIKTEKAEAAKLEAARLKASRAETARTETPKRTPVKEPKKEPKVGKLTGKPIDPYASEKAPKVDPSIAYKTGFQQYVRGDTGGALSTFKGSLSSSPGYPPTWRGLGLVYEKMGQKAQAKKSFLRYLQLSPKASDAEQIRARIDRLGS